MPFGNPREEMMVFPSEELEPQDPVGLGGCGLSLPPLEPQEPVGLGG